LKSGSLNFLEPSGLVQTCNGDCFLPFSGAFIKAEKNCNYLTNNKIKLGGF
jgi:hypothetical protein